MKDIEEPTRNLKTLHIAKVKETNPKGLNTV